jgi:excisionase family DNA binding protein
VERILLTPMEAADALHIGRTKIYDLIRNGELVSIKIGKLRRVPVEAVREYARRQLVEVGT